MIVVPTQKGQSNVSFHVCQLLKAMEEDFPARGAQTLASGLSELVAVNGVCLLDWPGLHCGSYQNLGV